MLWTQLPRLKQLPAITLNAEYPQGCTQVYSAILRTLLAVKHLHKSHPAQRHNYQAGVAETLALT